MQNLYGSDITADELRDEVGLDRDKLVDEFVEDALDEYQQREAALRSPTSRAGRSCASSSAS